MKVELSDIIKTIPEIFKLIERYPKLKVVLVFLAGILLVLAGILIGVQISKYIIINYQNVNDKPHPFIVEAVKFSVNNSVRETVAAIPTWTLVPTYTAYPTYTIYPTYTPLATYSEYPTATTNSSDNLVVTITPITQETLSPIYYCLNTENWRVQNKKPVSIKKQGENEFFDLTDKWGIFDKYDGEKCTIEFNVSEQGLLQQGLIRVIQLNQWDIKFVLTIKNISPQNVCDQNGICDVDLIIGIGDPFEQRGKFLVFRSTSKDSQIFLCELSGIYNTCTPKEKIRREILPVTYDISIKRFLNDFEIILNDEVFIKSKINDLAYFYPFFGYNIRSGGSIDIALEFDTSFK